MPKGGLGSGEPRNNIGADDDGDWMKTLTAGHLPSAMYSGHCSFQRQPGSSVGPTNLGRSDKELPLLDYIEGRPLAAQERYRLGSKRDA